MNQLRRKGIHLTLNGDRLNCKAPKGLLTGLLRQELAHHKADIVAFLQRAQAAKAQPSTPMQRVSREGPLPLSPAQKRLWFMDQLEGRGGVYNEPAALSLKGNLQVLALEQSLSEIVRRHEVLRTVFHQEQGVPVQVIQKAQPLTIPVVDLCEMPPKLRAETLDELAAAETRQPFHLASGPLLRFTLLRKSPRETILIAIMHHIISDGWSMTLFIDELSTLYEAFATGRPSPLQPLAMQYADFAHWQHQQLQTREFDVQMDYWRRQLKGAPNLLSLPTDRPRPPVQSFRGGEAHFEIDAATTASIKALGKAAKATLSVTLLALCKTLLCRYSGQRDLVVGSLVSGRSRTETQKLIGFFSNTLALRTDLQGNPSFEELLERVRRVVLEAFRHQELPFEQVVETLQPPRDPAFNPIFQVVFVFQSTYLEERALPGLRLSLAPLEAKSHAAKFDMVLSFTEWRSGITARIEYSTDLFDRTTINRFINHFQNLLKNILAAPQDSLDQLEIVAPEEQIILEMPTHIEELETGLRF